MSKEMSSEPMLKINIPKGTQDELPRWTTRTVKKSRSSWSMCAGIAAVLVLIWWIAYPSTDASSDSRHPITRLIEQGAQEWSSFETGTDKSFAEVVETYKQRYGRNPPTGFDAWYKYAKANAVGMIDNYDAIMKDLKPFRALQGKEVEARAKSFLPDTSAEAPRNFISVVQILGGNITVQHESGADATWDRRGEVFAKMLQETGYTFPDLWFPMNEDAPPRVLVSHENMLADEAEVGPLNFVSHEKGSLFEAIKAACPPDSPLASEAVRDIKTDATNFVSEPQDELDICNRVDLPLYHSAFRQKWWSTLDTLVPLFSYGTTTVHKDIRIPAAMYYFSDDELPQQSKYAFDPAQDVMWDEKKAAIHWRGRTTDGVADDFAFSAQQRHRLVNTGHEAVGSQEVMGVDARGKIVTEEIDNYDLNAEFMDVWFTRAMTGNRTCSTESDKECQQAKDNQPFLNAWSNHHDAWQNKYLADLDGYGYSAKFRGLLASTSVPIKSTLYQEFFSDWLVPWVHYVPMSHSMAELYNIMMYFNGGGSVTSKFVSHDEEARHIGEAGSQWTKNYMRKEDMIAYVFRLALEWARVCGDDGASTDLQS